MTDQQTTTTDNDLAERCFEALLRVEKIIHLATIAGDDMEGDLYDFLTEDCAEVLAGALGVEELESHLTVYGDRRDARREAFAEILIHKPLLGWLVQAAQPVMKKSGPGLSYSWGNYRTNIFYGATYEAALELAFTWAEEEHEKAMGG